MISLSFGDGLSSSSCFVVSMKLGVHYLHWNACVLVNVCWSALLPSFLMVVMVWFLVCVISVR